MKVVVLMSLLALPPAGAEQTPAGISSGNARLHFNSELRFGKCIGELCGRFGVRESTGGFGVDLRVLERRLTLRPELQQRTRALAPADPQRRKQ
jgi:hypothetical protein